VLASFARNPPAWLGKDLGIGRCWHNSGNAIDDFHRAAASICDPAFRRLDYAGLGPDALPSILDFFGIRPGPADLRLMLSEFQWDSKAAGARRSFA